MRLVAIASLLVLAACQDQTDTTTAPRLDRATMAANSAADRIEAEAGSLATNVDVQRVEAPGYSVESRSYTDANGDVHVRSSDTMGNSYGVDSRSYNQGNKQVVESSDTMGNSYRVESSCDASGSCTTSDSMGNRCTITSSGQMIGCGQ